MLLGISTKELTELDHFADRRRSVLIVLFIPNVERDGKTPVDQARWTDFALAMLGRVFGGATAYPVAKGIWRDDEQDGALIPSEPVVLHCYTTPEEIQNRDNLNRLSTFCRRMGLETNQGEVGVIIGEEYFAIRNFK